MLHAYKAVPKNSLRRERWKGEALAEFYDDWSERARVATSFIAPGSRILDLGCGSGLLRQFLPERCAWDGYDLRPLQPDVSPINLDAGEFPKGDFDYVVLLGVLGWLNKPVPVLKKARRAAPFLIANDKRRRWNWRNPIGMNNSELKPMLPGTGWSVRDSLEWGIDRRRHYSVCLLA